MTDSPSTTVPRQLSLGVRLSDDCTFANFLTDFFADDGSIQCRELVHLKQWLEQWCLPGKNADQEPFVFLAGVKGSGRSHLLQACCHEATNADCSAIYLPLSEFQEQDPEQVLEGLNKADIVCVDDLDLVVGNINWERELFNFYNELRDRQSRLLISANTVPSTIGITLPDLTSRLTWGPVFQLPTLDDAGKQQLLVYRAGLRGLELSNEGARYLLQRASRSTADLMAFLDRLDQVSLERKRLLTIPFIREVLEP